MSRFFLLSQQPQSIRAIGIAAASLLLLLALGISAPAQSAFVRVNQVGYVAGASKRAYLMTSTSATGATFAVKNAGGTTVFSGTVGANLGKWSNAFPNVYALDFSAASAPGSYTIAVTGPVAAT